MRSTILCGNLATCPNEMVPLQIDRAIGVGRYLFRRTANAVRLYGWSLRTVSAAGGTWQSEVELARRMYTNRDRWVGDRQRASDRSLPEGGALQAPGTPDRHHL